jgi:hypothetical protein
MLLPKSPACKQAFAFIKTAFSFSTSYIFFGFVGVRARRSYFRIIIPQQAN